MSFISVTDKYIATARNLKVDLYDYAHHKIIDIPTPPKPQDDDHVSDIAISTDNKYLAVITSTSKQLIVYALPELSDPELFLLPRSASKIRFAKSNSQILVADKTGDVLIYDLSTEDKGTKLLGHLSLLLDILQTNDTKFIITSDRDEKIKVSCYPNTYNIQTYCLGHKEFVNHIELLPHNEMLLVSSSGDGMLKIWDYLNGKAYYTIDTYSDIDNAELRDDFIKKMDKEEIEVDTLPVVHLAVAKLNEKTSLLAATVHTYDAVLVYSITSSDEKLIHKLETKIKLDSFPTSLQFHDSTLFVYNHYYSNITMYKYTFTNNALSLEGIKVENVFSNISTEQINGVENNFESIKLLYKRKFDNVQEYLERKKQRIEKTAIKSS